MLKALKKRFLNEVYPSLPNEWEVDDVLEHLLPLHSWQQEALLSRVQVVWPVSHSLCFSYLEYGAMHILRLGEDDLDDWIRHFLDCYERDGLAGARLFMHDVEKQFYDCLAGSAAVRLTDIGGKLQTFMRGVSSRKLEISVSSVPWTDSSTIFLPDAIHYFSGREDNRWFYTFLACCQWGYLVNGTFRSFSDPATQTGDRSSYDNVVDEIGFENFFSTFDDKKVAVNIYHYLEFASVYSMLSHELPGLMRRVTPLLNRLIAAVHDQDEHDACCVGFFYPFMCELFGDEDKNNNVIGENDSVSFASVRNESLRRVSLLYNDFFEKGSVDDWSLFRDFVGILQFGKVKARLLEKRAEEKNVFVSKLSLLLSDFLYDEHSHRKDESGAQSEGSDGVKLVVDLSEDTEDGIRSHTLRVNNTEIELPSDIAELIAEIVQDIGFVPKGYTQAAAGLAGRAVQVGEALGDAGAGQEQPPDSRAVLYDEWDYRRQGYRKNWCAVICKDLEPVKSRFIAATHLKYRGLMVRLRRQFEMLKTSDRYAKKRRHGDEIDFDALVDAVGDRAAGITPTDRLFIRLLRDQRDIAVMFLVDMSNSTEGWVGQAIKESLILLCDVLEVVGDRFGIYGFSGMRRSKCELYRIKEIDEPYSDRVEQRVCAISPREYTRMGPPIRHLTGELLRVDARVRLLITISDGKPEDYDDYKGDYAIEDTRQALIEARGKGVIPFCITVDRQAHSYLAHMFGKGHYIYVDSVEKLPARIPEVYRHITR